MPYYGVATGNSNSGRDEDINESKEHRAALGEGSQAGIRFGRGAYNPNEKN